MIIVPYEEVPFLAADAYYFLRFPEGGDDIPAEGIYAARQYKTVIFGYVDASDHCIISLSNKGVDELKEMGIGDGEWGIWNDVFRILYGERIVRENVGKIKPWGEYSASY